MYILCNPFRVIYIIVVSQTGGVPRQVGVVYVSPLGTNLSHGVIQKAIPVREIHESPLPEWRKLHITGSFNLHHDALQYFLDNPALCKFWFVPLGI